MAFELKEGQGSLFKNEKKEKESQPDYTGKVMIGGVEKRLAGWKKQTKNGGTFLSLQVSEFQAKQEAPASTPATEEDMPF